MRSIIVVFRNGHMYRSLCESRYGLVGVTQLLTVLIRKYLGFCQEKVRKTQNLSIEESLVLDLNLTLPNTKQALFSIKSHIVGAKCAKVLHQHERS